MATLEVDPYETLGVTRRARPSVIKSAYRALVREMHPDTGGDAAEFRAVREAWELLDDPARRAAWDAANPDTTQPQTGQERSAPRTDQTHTQPPPSPSATPRQQAEEPSSPAASSGSGEGEALRDVRAAHIPWTARFRRGSSDRIALTPGRGYVWFRVAMVLLTVAWVVVGGWIGVDAAVYGAQHVSTIPAVLMWMAWATGWIVAGLFTAFNVIAYGRYTPWMLLSAVWAWPAFSIEAGRPWAWVVYAWLAWMVVGTGLLQRARRPLVPVRHAVAKEWPYTKPSPGTDETAKVGRHLLRLIPAARICHQVGGAEVVVVCGPRVAAIGGDPLLDEGLIVKVWSSSVAADPQEAVTEIGDWLLAGSDGVTVDRRVLAQVCR